MICSSDAMDLISIHLDLAETLDRLEFSAPVTHVYNPLKYAWKPYEQYLKRYGAGSREIILLGMNPGPWGMAQTGVPFGEIEAVTAWLKINAPVGTPAVLHPKRPIQGFACTRREVSGKRLWGWVQNRYGSPENFFSRFFVANYCPLMFFDRKGANITPNQLKADDRKPLIETCDRALRCLTAVWQPRYVVGIGKFAFDRAQAALTGLEVVIGSVTHPSPANPKANRGWESAATAQLKAIGIQL
jgi:single-strand selective monofunctional uracil DNA glycosylase